MSLQIRLRHALGEKLLDLPERPAEQAVIIGRAREADVMIPSVAVAPRHCALFIHEGQWVAQDLGAGSTFINGQSIEHPTLLSIGDVLTLGGDGNAATIEIDPTGAARRQFGQPAMARTSAAAPRVMMSPTVAAPSYPPAAYQQSPATAPEYTAAYSPQDPDVVAWPQAAPTASPSTFRLPAKKRSSDAALFAGIVAALAIALGTGAFWYLHRPEVQEKKAAAPAVVDAPSNGRPKNIFTNDDSEKPPAKPAAPGAGRSTSSVTKTPKVGGTDDSSTPSDEAAAPQQKGDDAQTDPAPPELESAHFLPDQALAILKFEDYRREHPNDHKAILDQYTDEALDLLWWNRIGKLVNKRDRLTKEISKKNKDIRDETETGFKKQLQGELVDLEKQLAKTREVVTSELGYTEEEEPDTADAVQMQKLRAARDAGKFAAWKPRTTRYILLHHGQTPWSGEE